MVICAKSFIGARDEHTISSVPSRAKLFASAVAFGLAGGGASGLFHFGCGGHAGGEKLLRAVGRRRGAQQSVRSEDAVEGVGVRVCQRSSQFAQDRAKVGIRTK